MAEYARLELGHTCGFSNESIGNCLLVPYILFVYAAHIQVTDILIDPYWVNSCTDTVEP
jgi:hypothetical protein